MGLSKRKIFIDEYLKSWNATKAAKRAGYSEKTSYSSGQRLLKNDEVQQAIQDRLSASAMSADEVIEAIGEIGRASIEDLMDVDENGRLSFNFKRAKEQGKLHLIKSITPTPSGTKVELHDRMRALELMGKHHKLFTENVQLDGEITFNVKYADGLHDNSTETP
ncbi:MAG: terminase small subunit [Clostridia bacterium]